MNLIAHAIIIYEWLLVDCCVLIAHHVPRWWFNGKREDFIRLHLRKLISPLRKCDIVSTADRHFCGGSGGGDGGGVAYYI